MSCIVRVPQTPAAQSRGCLLASHQNESPGRTVARTNPGFCVWGSSWRKESLPPIFALLKIPQSGPILRKQQFTKRNCCGFPARKHPTPPGTGTEPGALSGLGAAPAPGTRQFSKALLAVGPPVLTDPREMTTQKILSKSLFQQGTLHHKCGKEKIAFQRQEPEQLSRTRPADLRFC